MKTVSGVISGQALETVGPKNTIVDALSRMESKRIHSLLVFDGEEFVGIVTMSDIAHAHYGQIGGEVEHIMTKAANTVFVNENDTVQKCSQMIRESKRHLHHLVVKNDNNQVVGVVSTVDLMV